MHDWIIQHVYCVSILQHFIKYKECTINYIVYGILEEAESGLTIIVKYGFDHYKVFELLCKTKNSKYLITSLAIAKHIRNYRKKIK